MVQAFIQPYLFFGGRTEEAIEFYKNAIGAELEMLMRFNESPVPTPEGKVPPGFENKVMHASFKVGSSSIMASDGTNEELKFSGFFLSLSVPTEAEADRAFAALADGGKVEMPLGQTFWSPKFGMLTDKFGMGWMVSVAPQ